MINLETLTKDRSKPRKLILEINCKSKREANNMMFTLKGFIREEWGDLKVIKDYRFRVKERGGKCY